MHRHKITDVTKTYSLAGNYSIFLYNFLTLPLRTHYNIVTIIICIMHDYGILCQVFASLTKFSHVALMALWENYMGEGQVRDFIKKNPY